MYKIWFALLVASGVAVWALAEPAKAVYRWGQGGCEKGLYDQYEWWLALPAVWGEDFTPKDTWLKVTGEAWELGPWSEWVHAKPGRRYVLSVPMLVGPWDRSGPKSGPLAGQAVSLQKAAEGAYNEFFVTLAQHLVQRGLSNTVLRLGWEFNGSWYTYRANTAEEARAFAAAWRSIVGAMRAVPGQAFEFCWNPALEPWWPYDPELAWPGDEWVDSIGLDVYDQSWIENTYPIPPEATPGEALARRKRVWAEKLLPKSAFGLEWWRDFAQRHGNKPLALPEWGVCNRPDGHGGGDNAYFIEQLTAWMRDPANGVAWECYFDVGADDGDHQLVPNPRGKNPTHFPEPAQAYHRLFAQPGAPAWNEAPAPKPGY